MATAIQNNFRSNPKKRKLQEPNDIFNNFYDEQNEKVDWKKLKQDRKDVKLKRKVAQAGGSDTFMISAQAKIFWEQLRRSDCKESDKLAISAKLHDLIKGKIGTLIQAHDTVRVIECLVASGGEDVRAQIFLELENHLLTLCKSKYAKFFVIKMLRCGTKSQKNKIIDSMMGQVVKLTKHKEACDVVELAYNNCANAKQRSSIIQEFYGKRFQHLKEDIKSVQDAIEKHPEIKENIISNVERHLQPILDKGVFTNTMVHTLMKEYMMVCDAHGKANMIDCLKDKLSPILHTRDGARVAMMCLWYGTPKDRKAILKSLKTFFVKIAREEHGFMVLLAAFDCVDDTVFVKKAVINELMDGIDKILSSESGIKVLKYLVASRDKLFFHPDVIKVLEIGDGNTNTKKERTVIHKELREAVSEPLLKIVLNNIVSWSKESKWTLFVGACLKNLAGPLIEEVYAKLAETCCCASLPGTNEGHFLDVGHASQLIRCIVMGDKDRAAEGKPIFSATLLSTCEAEVVSWTLTNRGCFLLVKMIETGIEDVKQTVIDIVKPICQKLTKKNYPGAKLLIEKCQ